MTACITKAGALPGDLIGEERMAVVLASPSTVIEHVRQLSTLHVIVTATDLSALTATMDECRKMLKGIQANVAYREVFPSPPARCAVAKTQHEPNIIHELKPIELPWGVGMMKCSNGHFYFLEDRIRAANAAGHKHVTCGEESCDQRIPFAVLKTLNLDIIADVMLMGVEL